MYLKKLADEFSSPVYDVDNALLDGTPEQLQGSKDTRSLFRKALDKAKHTALQGARHVKAHPIISALAALGIIGGGAYGGYHLTHKNKGN